MDERKLIYMEKFRAKRLLKFIFAAAKEFSLTLPKQTLRVATFFARKGLNCVHSECSLFIFVSRSGLSRYEGDLQIGIIAEIYGNLDPSQIRDNPSSKYFHVEATECVSPALVLLSIFLRMLVMLFWKHKRLFCFVRQWWKENIWRKYLEQSLQEEKRFSKDKLKT